MRESLTERVSGVVIAKSIGAISNVTELTKI